MIITAADFKLQFPRFTPEYLPVYTQGTYFKGDIVYYEGLFYKAIVDSTTNLPTDTSDWELYNDSVLNYTQDGDILNASLEANVNFNEGLFPDEAIKKLVFLYLVAHYLTIDFRNALGTNQIGLVASKSVGSVSESYSIPNWIMGNAGLAPYATTGYGIKYATLLRPYLVGNFFIAKGGITYN